KKVFISYSLMSNSRDKLLPSGFVSGLQKIFSVNGQPLSPMRTADYISFLKTQQDTYKLCEDFVYFCASKQNAMHEVLKLKYESDFNKSVLTSLFEFIKSDFKNYGERNVPEKFSPEEIAELNFPNNTVTVSKVEKYYSCPFKQFANYALKLKERDVSEVLPFDIGNFLHKIAEEFLNHKNDFVNRINSQNIVSKNEKKNKTNLILINVVKNIIEKLKANKKFYKFNLKLNRNIAGILEKESIRLCEFLLYSQSVSKFRPAYLEVFFGGKGFPSYEIKVGENVFYITGIVDRIDIYNDMFIIIDYKSGTEGTGGASELYYGDKIQIYAYLKILEKILNKKPCGAFYFPVKNEYKDEKNKEKEYQLKGKAIDDTMFLTAMDTSVNFNNPTSKIFSCKLNSSKKILESGEKKYSKIYTISSSILSNMEEYSIKMVENAIKEMLEGNILPSPRKNACNFCKFASLCGYDKKQGFRDSVYKIINSFFESEN
ncbi:MAG: PD-(D/E)XK nuclease family protein, partial [Clostridia bacterium]|nr:PD-(D/E)XK nuclease family protein [Clostridia bacterium]